MDTQKESFILILNSCWINLFFCFWTHGKCGNLCSLGEILMMPETPFVIKVTVSHCGESLWTNEYNRIKLDFPTLLNEKNPRQRHTWNHVVFFQWNLSLQWVFPCFFPEVFVLKPNFSNSRIYFPVTYSLSVKADWLGHVFHKGLRRFCGHPKLQNYLVGGFKYFLFSPLPGEMIQFD